MNYTHLTREERYQIYALHRRGVSISAIASDLGRHRSTIGRELVRNTSAKGYKPACAHTQAKARLSGPMNVRTVTREDWARVVRHLQLDHSPQQISGRLRLQEMVCISAECIYQRIYKDKAQGGQLVQHLRCQKPRRKRYASAQERRGTLKNCKRIDERPKVVDRRSRIADWEGDTVIGRGHQGVLVTRVRHQNPKSPIFHHPVSIKSMSCDAFFRD